MIGICKILGWNTYSFIRLIYQNQRIWQCLITNALLDMCEYDNACITLHALLRSCQGFGMFHFPCKVLFVNISHLLQFAPIRCLTNIDFFSTLYGKKWNSSFCLLFLTVHLYTVFNYIFFHNNSYSHGIECVLQN